MGQRVEVRGTTRDDMNGKLGVAIDYHPMRDNGGWGAFDLKLHRYTVELDR